MGRSLRLVAAIAAAFLVGCGDDDKSTAMDADAVKAGKLAGQPVDAPQFQGTFTLQGAVMNAVTGARVAGDDLQLWLIQGEEIRTPTRLERDATRPLAGEYAFSGIPADFFAGNKVYKIVAVAPGYQRFEGEISYDFLMGTMDEPVLDTIYNRIGNIYLFPTGVSAPDYAFTVTFFGKGVPNATVLLSPCVQDNQRVGEGVNAGSTIAASPGYVPSLSATTDAAGRATFAGAQLALGACYQPWVLPVGFEGVQLQKTGGAEIVAGLAVHEQVIPVGELEPGADALGLWVTSASNAVAGAVQADGRLVLRFSRPVSLVNPTGFTAVATAGTLNPTPVSASLSGDGLEVTLAPSFATPPLATDKNVAVTYGNGTAGVSIQGYPDAAFQLFGPGGLVTGSGGLLNPTVVLVGP